LAAAIRPFGGEVMQGLCWRFRPNWGCMIRTASEIGGMPAMWEEYGRNY
jgi:hypothetical protein